MLSHRDMTMRGILVQVAQFVVTSRSSSGRLPSESDADRVSVKSEIPRLSIGCVNMILLEMLYDKIPTKIKKIPNWYLFYVLKILITLCIYKNTFFYKISQNVMNL